MKFLSSNQILLIFPFHTRLIPNCQETCVFKEYDPSIKTHELGILGKRRDRDVVRGEKIPVTLHVIVYPGRSGERGESGHVIAVVSYFYILP